MSNAGQFSFFCPYCGHRITTGVRNSGRTGTCHGCNQPVVIPAVPSTFQPALGQGTTMAAPADARAIVGWILSGGSLGIGVMSFCIFPLALGLLAIMMAIGGFIAANGNQSMRILSMVGGTFGLLTAAFGFLMLAASVANG